jgi:cation:H+ antiporter
VPTLDRDLTVFLVFFAIALLLGIGLPLGLRIVTAVALVLAYAIYVQRTLAGGGELQPEETLGPLIISRTRGDDPTTQAIVTQFVIGLAAMIGGAHLFVEEVTAVAEEIGLEVLVLSLVLAPLATELPEKANSFFWVRDGKDALALGNITGAMVFQSMIPIAIGLAFTDWDLDRFAVLSIVLGLAGGIVAYWALRLRGQFNARSPRPGRRDRFPPGRKSPAARRRGRRSIPSARLRGPPGSPSRVRRRSRRRRA